MSFTNDLFNTLFKGAAPLQTEEERKKQEFQKEMKRLNDLIQSKE